MAEEALQKVDVGGRALILELSSGLSMDGDMLDRVHRTAGQEELLGNKVSWTTRNHGFIELTLNRT